MEWAEPAGDKCPLCDMAEPHRHNLREDGTFGVIVEKVSERMRDKMQQMLNESGLGDCKVGGEA